MLLAILTLSLDGGDAVRIASSDSGAVYSEPGYLLFVRQGTLVSNRFDRKTLQLIGQATPIADALGFQQGAPAFSVSNNGTLVYRAGGGAENVQMAWFDRNGKPAETIAQPGRYMSPSVSPDGRRVAVHRHDGNGGDIWLVDRGTTARFTFDAF